MKKKIIVIFACTLMIATADPVVCSMNNKKNTMMTENSSTQSLTRADWNEIQKLLASDGATDDYFGWSVSIDDVYAVIGAFGDDSCRGAAYIFKRSGTIWSQEAKLTASDGEEWDYFGQSVSIGGDYAIVGTEINNLCGAAYVFKRSSTIWIQEAKLVASDSELFDFFGGSVSISKTYILIGSYDDDDNGIASGSAYIFTKIGENLPPLPPTITGPAKGKPNVKYNYTLNTVDPESDNVYYYIDWGDGTNSGWVGSSTSGFDIIVNHTWAKKGIYTVKAKAKDVNNAESDWVILEVTIPKIKSFNLLTMKIIERFSNTFPILQKIIQRLGLQ